MSTVVIRSLRRRSLWKRPRRWSPRREHKIWVNWLDRQWELEYVPRRGYHAVAAYRFTGGNRVAIASYPRPEYAMRRKQPGSGAGSTTQRHLAAVESNLFSSLMNLVEHCTVTRYDDGEPRKPGWFTVKTLGAAWIVQVKDPDGQCQMNATAQSLDDALALADVLLGSEEAPWEPDPFLMQRKPRKAA